MGDVLAQPASAAATAWPPTKKWSTVITGCTCTFLVGINATALLAAANEVSEEYGIDNSSFDNYFFLVTVWSACAAVVPLFVLPAMEDYGVRWIYCGFYISFTAFVVMQALAKDFATLMAARALAGSCAGVLQNAIDGMIADMWGNDSPRMTFSLSIFIFTLLGGVTWGSVMGGLIIQSLTWPWISYIQIIIYVAFFPAVILFLHDTRADSSKSTAPIKTRIFSALNDTVLRSSKMFFTEFVVSSFTIWSAFAFGTVFVLSQSVPLVFTTRYDWPEWQASVVQTAVLIGELLGVLLSFVQDFVVYPRYSNRTPTAVDDSLLLSSRLPPNPEARLYMSIPASFVGLTAGFFIYGWTSLEDAKCAWQLPALGLLFIGIAIMTIIQAVATYVTDCYLTHANSAVSVIAFGENIFAAFLPLATRVVYERLGFAWASSLLGFLGIAVSVGPFLLVLFGPRIRAASTMIG